MVPKKDKLEKLKIISTYHHGYAGGSKNTSRLLHNLSNNGCAIEAFFFEKPQYFTYTKSNVDIHTLKAEDYNSEVIDFSLIKNYSLSDRIFQASIDKEAPILFGANIFPYCNILHDVKSQLYQLNNREPKLIVHPVGSDLWQIGTQLKSRVKWLLESPLVNSVVTYSETFLREIQEYYNITREMYVLPPILEKEKFFAISQLDKSKRRKILGFGDDDFIIHHHSSMRQIKCPEIIIDIAFKASQLVVENCILIMTGPVPHSVLTALNLNLIENKGNDLLKFKTIKGNLIIYWTGVLSTVEYLMQISDIELNASIHDSFNLSLMEAMACGLPVVTSNVVGISNHINKADAGFCFPTQKLNFDEINKVLLSNKSKEKLFDIDYATDAIITLAKDKRGSQIKGEAGAKYVLNEFNIEKVMREFYKHIN